MTGGNEIMTDDLKISVIVAVYNTEKYLRKCLDSVCGQSYNNLEILLCDDASTDGTPRICREYAGRDPRVRVIDSTVNTGIAATRNRGLEAASGEWVTFVDGDDWLETDCYEVISEYLSEDIDFLKYNAEKESRTKPFDMSELDGRTLELDDRERDRINFMTFARDRKMNHVSWLLVINRRLHGQLRYVERHRREEDLIYFEDLLYSSDKCLFIDRKLYHHSFNPNGLVNSGKTIPEGIEGKLDVLTMLMEKYGDRMKDETKTAVFSNQIRLLDYELVRLGKFDLKKYRQTVKRIRNDGRWKRLQEYNVGLPLRYSFHIKMVDMGLTSLSEIIIKMGELLE